MSKKELLHINELGVKIVKETIGLVLSRKENALRIKFIGLRYTVVAG